MGRKKLKPHIPEDKMVSNPLTATDFKILVRKKKERKFSEEGGKVDYEVELEVERYVKLFVGSDRRKVLSLLSNPGKSLFLWLIYEIENAKDYVWINRDRYMDEMNISSINTYKAGVVDLVNSNVLAPSLIGGVFWINPRVFFSGSRINKYPDKIVYYEPKTNQN